MKQGTFLTKTVIWLFFFAILAYLGIYLTDALLHPLKTEPVYAYSMDRGVSVSGVFVRDELPIASSADLIDVVPSEGERVGKDQTLARIYTDRESLERENDKEEITRQLEQLAYFRGTESLDLSGKELDEKITETVSDLRAEAAQKQLTELGDTAQALKNLIFQRDYVYYGADGIEQMTATLKQRLSELEKQGKGGYTSVYAPAAGAYSALVDGFEDILNPEAVREMTPSGFQAVVSSKSGEAESGYLGKLILGSQWYYAFLIDEADGKMVKEGSTLQLRFEREFSASVSMHVEYVSKAEDGQVLVVASSGRYLAETTLLRKQSAELINTSGSGLRVPKEAVRVNENGTIGVYCLTGIQAKFKPVDIVYESENFYLVENDRSNGSALREGDEVIVSGEGLFDGKVVA
jgi:putative membrane fusion protein